MSKHRPTLREIYEADWMGSGDSRRLFNFHRDGSRFSVDDTERSDRPNSRDRAGNNKDVFSGSVSRPSKPPARPKGSDEQDWDLGKKTKNNIGNLGTSLPQAAMRYAGKDDV
jgi:hypothetical protein